MDSGMGDTTKSPSDKTGRVHIRVHADDYQTLIVIQGRMCVEQGRPVYMPEVIHEMCEKWDSLIKSYDSLKNLPEA